MNLIGRVVRAIAAALESCRRGHHWGGGTVPTLGHALAGVGYSASFVGTASHGGLAHAGVGFGATSTGFQNEIHIGRATAYSGVGASLVGTAAENDIHVGLATAGVGFRGSVLGTKVDARPSAPVLQGTAGNARCDLSWTIPNGNGAPVTGYLLIRNLFQGSQTTVYDGPLTSYTDFAVTNDTEYTYTVVAYNAIGNNSVGSNVVTLTPNTGVPAAPVLAGTSGDAVANLTWAAPASGSPLQPYTLNRTNGATTITVTPAPAANATSYQNTGLNNNTQYTYRLTANNLSGPSQPSNSVPLTPIAGGAPVLPANQAIGRAASDFGFWAPDANLGFTAAAEVNGWRTNIGMNVMYCRFYGAGYLPGYNAPQRLRVGTAFAAPYSSDSTYDYQRGFETSGPFQAKRNGNPIKVGFFVKLHKPRDNTYTAPNVGGDLGPFGGAWSDNTHWAAVCAAIKLFVQGAKWLGVTHYNLDPEFGTWDYPPIGMTLAAQKVLIDQRGFEVGKAWMEADPDAQMSHYGTPMPGSFHREVVYKNDNPSDGAYFHTPGAADEDNAANFEDEYPPTPISSSHAYHQDQGYAAWQHRVFYRGFWRAMAIYASDLATWTFHDAFWYHAQVQYSGLPSSPTTYEYAMRWGLWGTFSHLSRDPQLSQTTKNWLCRHFKWCPVSWAMADHNNGYFNSQLREPEFSNLVKAGRVWGMGIKVEYGNGVTTPSSFASNETSTAGSANLNSRGRPLSISYGYNLYTGAKGSPAPTTGVLGNQPTGGGSPGQTITYRTADLAATPADWSVRYPVPASRSASLLAACSTASIGTTWPTVTGPAGTGNPTAVRAGSNVTISCRVTHAHSPWYVAVYRGTNFNRNNPEPNLLGVMTMVFEPNNGTNLPPAGLTSPYMQCTFATTGTAGEFYVLKAVSTKEDERWLNVQSN